MLAYKFRAWYKPTGKMIPWAVLEALMGGNSVHIEPRIEMPASIRPGDKLHESRIIRPGSPFSNPDLVMMQFTGFQDIAGTDIYQGDLVHIKQYNPKVYAVDIIDGGFCMTHSSCLAIDINHFNRDGERIECRLTSNIYENPDWER